MAIHEFAFTPGDRVQFIGDPNHDVGTITSIHVLHVHANDRFVVTLAGTGLERSAYAEQLRHLPRHDQDSLD